MGQLMAARVGRQLRDDVQTKELEISDKKYLTLSQDQKKQIMKKFTTE